jgi:hypothetical protein
MRPGGVDRLLAFQHATGCFPSTVTRGGGRSVDWNGFVTATVLRSLRHLPDTTALGDLRRRGLDFLRSCRSTQVPDAFAFWPDRSRPAWASAVPPDADDTAIMAAELLRHARLDRAAGLRSVCRLIASCRVRPEEAGRLPDWVAPGSFVTWITPGERPAVPGKRLPNVVDCCVNANVVALMSELNARHLPGYAEAIRTVLGGLRWSGDDERRLRTLTPFYPSPRSLLEAIEHAIECGADGLREGAAHLRSIGVGLRDLSAGCCSSAYGGTVWYCEAIDVARALSSTC